MSDKVDKWVQEMREYWGRQTREEFKKDLEDAGFTVVDGEGRIVDEDGNEIKIKGEDEL